MVNSTGLYSITKVSGEHDFTNEKKKIKKRKEMEVQVSGKITTESVVACL